MEPRPVEVEHAGRWYPGWVHDVQQRPDGRWRGLVTFTIAPGEQFYRWEPQDVIRPAAEPVADRYLGRARRLGRS